MINRLYQVENPLWSKCSDYRGSLISGAGFVLESMWPEQQMWLHFRDIVEPVHSGHPTAQTIPATSLIVWVGCIKKSGCTVIEFLLIWPVILLQVRGSFPQLHTEISKTPNYKLAKSQDANIFFIFHSCLRSFLFSWGRNSSAASGHFSFVPRSLLPSGCGGGT